LTNQIVHRRTFKYRIYPTAEQIVRLELILRLCCELYNAALQERRDAWKLARKSISFYDQDEQLKEIWALRPDCGAVYAHVLREVLFRVERAFDAFFRRCKSGEKPGFPRFKSARRYDSFTYHDGFKLKDNYVRLGKFGSIKAKLHRPVDGIIKTCSIKREAGRWYVCFSCEVAPKPLATVKAEVGIDVGLESFAVLSDGSEVDNPRHYRWAQAKLRRAQRKVSRRKKGSNRRRKAVRCLSRIHIHIRNQRSDFHHKLSHDIVSSYQLIAVEDLNIKGLARARNAKSIHDAGWNSFLQKIAYKAESAGRDHVKVDPRGTSQRCVCGQPNPKELRDRKHRCENCGLDVGRDHASALEILRLGRSLRSFQPDVVVSGAARTKKIKREKLQFQFQF
jgi:putative transposase